MQIIAYPVKLGVRIRWLDSMTSSNIKDVVFLLFHDEDKFSGDYPQILTKIRISGIILIVLSLLVFLSMLTSW
jgi:hypothetical protein